jgi:hypothetical protein
MAELSLEKDFRGNMNHGISREIAFLSMPDKQEPVDEIIFPVLEVKTVYYIKKWNEIQVLFRVNFDLNRMVPAALHSSVSL